MRQAPAGRTAGTKQRRDTVSRNACARAQAARSRRAFQRAKRLASRGKSSSARPSAPSLRVRRAASIGSSGKGARGTGNSWVRPGMEMRGNPLAAGRLRAFQRGSGSNNGKARVRGGGARGPALGRKPRGITMPVPMPLRRIVDVGLGLRGPRRRQGDDDPARGHDDQPPRRGFGRAQQAEHGTVEMARQGGQGGRRPARPWRRAWPARASAPRDSSRLPHSSPSTPSSIQDGEIIAPPGRAWKSVHGFSWLRTRRRGRRSTSRGTISMTWLDGAAQKSRKNRKQREWYPRFRVAACRAPGGQDEGLPREGFAGISDWH